jgi:hypothetical protein
VVLKQFVKSFAPAFVVERYRGYRLTRYRKAFALSYYKDKFSQIDSWLVQSGESDNFTYELTIRNVDYLAAMISFITGHGYLGTRSFIDEVNADDELKKHIGTVARRENLTLDDKIHFSRRIGWYAFVRILKPKVVIETGVHHGLGAVVLCAALLRNRDEGYDGRYYGTDIDVHAGRLLSGKYAAIGQILYGDSLESLQALNLEVDVFVNDSDHSEDYEYREYQVIKHKLSENAIVLGDNSHSSSALFRFSIENGRRFLFFREEPLNHWYPGAGIGMSFFPRG